MWTHAIVVLAPPLDDDLCLLERHEDFAVEQLGIMEQEHQTGSCP